MVVLPSAAGVAGGDPGEAGCRVRGEQPENRAARGLDPTDCAENTKWLERPYIDQIHGKAKSWIDTYVMNRVGVYREGKPVYESFQPEWHVAKEKLSYVKSSPLIVGLDFARNPAMVCVQVIRGTVFVLDEFGVENYAATTYAPLFRQRLAKKFPEALTTESAGVQFWGDPTGDSASQSSDITPYAIFKQHGMMVAPCQNTISLRLNAVQSQLDKSHGGVPGLLLDPRCLRLKTGFVSEYHYAKIKGTHGHHPEPNKKMRAADYHDALQYACLGAGLGTALIAGTQPTKPKRREKKKFSLMKR